MTRPGRIVGAFAVWSLACGGVADLPRQELARLAAAEPENLSAAEASVRQYFHGLQADLERLLDEGAEAPRLARAAGRLGMWYHVHQHYDDARSAFELAETLDPADAAWPYYLGHAAQSLGDPAAARAAWERSGARRPEYLPTHLQLAELEVAEGDLEAARRSLEDAARLDVDHPRLQVVRGEVALQEGRFDEARDHFAAALEERPQSRRARYGLGMALRGLGRYPHAQRHLAASAGAADADPTLGLEDPYLAELAASDTSSLKLWRRGRAALQAGRLDEAADWLRKSLEVAPDRADYRVELGTALARAGRVEEAQAAYREALDSAPGHDGARMGLAALHAAAGRTEEAEAELRRLLELRPDHPAAHLHLAHLLRSRPSPAAAIPHYERAVELDPRSESARFWRAWTHHLLGDSATAVRLLDGDLDLLGDQAMLLSLKARLGTRPGAAAAEIAAAHDIALRLFERSANAFYAETLAMTLAARSEFEEAVQVQQAALDAARAAGVSDLQTMAARLADYRSRRRAGTLLADADTATVDVRLEG